MNVNRSAANSEGGASPEDRGDANAARPSRRDIVRRGAKLAFIAPLLTTFLAEDAYAAGSNHSCYASGHACGLGGEQEACCAGLSCTANTCQ
ncbi:MAG: hypothetical protein IID36_02725 [Planctomycetes bacterium]|nr:hypothetical protein [Planctomycetota bacterium]